MTQIYNHSAPKKPTNLSINSSLLEKARSLKLNLSATLEAALAEEVRKAEREQWLVMFLSSYLQCILCRATVKFAQ